MTDGDQNRPSTDGALCAQCGQEHPRCAAHCTSEPRRGEPCMRWPIRGATVCYKHGGMAGQVRAAAARNVALGVARLTLGVPVDVDPAEAMLGAVREAAGNVELYRQLVQTLEAGGGDHMPEAGDGPAIAGFTGSTSKLFDAAPHVWVTMYDAERERLVRWAKACRDAGVDERLVHVAEGQAAVFARALVSMQSALLAMALDATSAGDVVRGELEAAWQARAPGIMKQALLDVSSRAEGGNQ